MEADARDTHQIIVIGAAAIVLHNVFADSLMDDISLFAEENTKSSQKMLALALDEC